MVLTCICPVDLANSVEFIVNLGNIKEINLKNRANEPIALAFTARVRGDAVQFLIKSDMLGEGHK